MRTDAAAMLTELPVAYLDEVTAAAAGALGDIPTDGEDGVLPAELRAWLVRLRLLEGVPFANLVPDTELLPEESIRWFYLDRRWTDALVQGALSVGTVNSDDRVALTAAYPAVRDELDTEERNVRRPPGSERFGGAVEAVSGFVLRSKAVSGWPALHVRAFSSDPAKADDARFTEDEPERMRLLRLERLAPAVLFVLFDGIPTVVHLEEPRQGVQFGAERDPGAPEGVVRFTVQPRDRATFDDLGGAPVTVPFRADGAPGVVDIHALRGSLGARLSLTEAQMNSAEYALQLIRLPYRQVWGEPRNTPIATIFAPTVSYADLVTRFVTMEADHG
ncbi:MAG: hypothetical protein IE926_20170 [Micrococcales bacterium]|nr:hypothetical protein [Micrococcales bacterium]